MAIRPEDIERVYGEKFTAGNEVHVSHDGTTAFEMLFRSVREARRTILLVFYIFRDDRTGRELADLLKEKARQGIRVCVLYDHFGSMLTPRSFWKDMARSGVEVRASRPFRWSAPGEYIHRDHRKLVVVDGRVAFTGGLNIADEYRGQGFFRKKWKGWRDTAVIVKGPAAARLHEIFRKTWEFWGGSPVLPADAHADGRAAEGLSVIPIFSSSARGRRRMRKLLYWCIRNAEHSICLTTAYFIPSRRMMYILREAAERGVRVRLMLPCRSDLKAVMYASRAMFSRLLKWGVEIYLYRDSILHAKSYVFDNIFSIVGSANLDFQSLRKNDEGNVGVFAPAFAGEMQAIFERDVSRSVRVEPEQWLERPLHVKILERFFLLFRRRL